VGSAGCGFSKSKALPPLANDAMKIVLPLLLAATLALTYQLAETRIKRSQSAKVEFKQREPCPATGARQGSCKGYVIDHIKPLACGGADAPRNMQWQTVADAKAKDKWERRECGK
jgi:hypothetical protein